ncbi:MAG: hypothetical protein DMG37_20950 [Acidobacteria bacterium]|nr:MAG: hypothetical protein DMG37_20950 [Acidobacteriota bacterium]
MGGSDLWQTQDLAAFLKKAEVCVRRMRKTMWRGDISEPDTNAWRLPSRSTCGRLGGKPVKDRASRSANIIA